MRNWYAMAVVDALSGLITRAKFSTSLSAEGSRFLYQSARGIGRMIINQ